MEKIKVGILGATGTVGQTFIALLEGHPFFEVHELMASERSAGKRYVEACRWKQNSFIPEKLKNRIVKSTEERVESPLIFSGMDANFAGEIEKKYAHDGHFVISNTSNHRMDPQVPLIIPEVNPDHFEILKHQPYRGGIITNSNCSTMFMAMVLAPLHRAFGIKTVQVTTMQAISGAGYPGVASMDILGNIVPHIKGEEAKMEVESQKILGRLENDHIVSADYAVSAQCNRVPVFDGHTEALSLKFTIKPTAGEVEGILGDFRGLPQERNLPSAPKRPILIFHEEDRPQPARDVWKNKGMSTCVGRVREDNVADIKMVILGHNTVRGAAGAAILNAETFVALGYTKKLAKSAGKQSVLC